MLHKLITFLINPLTVSIATVVVATALLRFGRRLKDRREGLSVRLIGLAKGLYVFAFCWLWLWSMPAMNCWLGRVLEGRYPPVAAESVETGDVIVLLGGGIGRERSMPYPEMWSGADRVWHAARLWHAGKAKVVYCTDAREATASGPLLKDLGVPESAIQYGEEVANTADEARAVAARFHEKKVLLVTSAWHMKRAHGLFRKAGVNVIPCATDHEATVHDRCRGMTATSFLPASEYLFQNAVLLKEIVANVGYGIW